ncbi:hypothetical protein MEBOL_000496 [Melittangium boletus DSM 14713]|uniref:Uncharacterized protein n=1 Tax=Melittangium boletus DSM 14713 TaxID=1294270 RepID=A0A250I7C0_9BACT|nr:hypothetical protein MEBOL_000496 [Melittangium boletus DSM 14713]
MDSPQRFEDARPRSIGVLLEEGFDPQLLTQALATWYADEEVSQPDAPAPDLKRRGALGTDALDEEDSDWSVRCHPARISQRCSAPAC